MKRKRETNRNSDHDVRVPLEHLHDLARLEVPDVRLVVLAPRDDPLAARDAEARGDAVLCVGVPGVGLEAARGLVVPEADGAVVRGGEDVFRVGGELDVLADGVVALGEGLETLAVGGVPDAAGRGIVSWFDYYLEVMLTQIS
jgi:hypothetical protein